VPERSTVLVVDDEVGPRESLRAILKPDYQVLVAAEGEHAIRVIEQVPVDVVLLDLRMPGLSGMRVMEKIKAVDPTIEVILVTGYASYDTVLEGLRLHAFDYVPKPFSVPRLREAVKQAAVRRHTQIELRRAKEESEQRFRDLVQDLDAIVWESDLPAVPAVEPAGAAPLPKFSFVSRRAQEILGYPVEHWFTVPDFWTSLIHAEDRERLVALRRAATAEGKDHDCKYRARAADGRVVWLWEKVHVVRDEEGRARQLRGFTLDITECERRKGQSECGK